MFAIVAFFSFQHDASAKEFSDVPKTHLYYHEIKSLTDSGIINGYQDGTFKPENYITNRQVATMMVRLLDAYDIPYEDMDQYFIDITKKDSAYKEISIMLNLGLMRYKYSRTISSTGEIIAQGWKFYPNDYITREDMAFTLASALFITGDESITFDDTKGNSLNEPEISVLADNKIVTGYSKQEFGPKRPITRAHFAVIMCRAMQALEKQNKNLLDELDLYEATSPLGSYIKAGLYNSAKGSVYDFAYGKGRFAIVSTSNSNIRFLDLYTLKTTPDRGDGSIVEIHGDLAVWVDDRNGPLHFVDLSTKAKNIQTVDLPNIEVSGLHFSEDGQYLFLESNSEVELLPQKIYDLKNKRFIEIPYYDVSLTDWENGELYFWGMSDFDYVEKSSDGYSITNMVKGLYAYNPATNKARTIYEESMDTLDYRTYTIATSFDVSKNLGVFTSDTGIFLIDLHTGNMTLIKSHTEGNTSSHTPVTILDNHLYYVEGASIIKQSIDTRKKEKLYTFSGNPSHEDLTLSIKGNYLFVYGSGAPMTIIRIR